MKKVMMIRGNKYKKIEKDIGDFIAETYKKEYYLSIHSILCCKSPNDYEKKEWKKS